MDFGSYLENCIRKKGISINALTKACGINRGGLYSIFKNERKLKEDKLFEIIKIAGLNSAEEEKLIRLYFCDYFGESEFQRIENLLNEIQKVGRDRNFEPDLPPFQKKDILIGEEIDSALKVLIDTNEVITTNFSYSCERIDQIFYSAVSSGKIKELHHIITLYEDSEDEHNYQTLFSSFKYMYLQQFPYYQWNSLEQFEHAISFQYFAVGFNGALLFNDDWGIFIEDKTAVAKLNDKAAALLDRCTQLGDVVEDIMAIKQLYQRSFSDKGIAISFQGYLCVAPFADYEFVFSIVRRELPQYELLARIAYEHYKSIFETLDFFQFATIDGLKEFAKTGNVAEVPGTLVQPADIPQRIKILKKIILAAERGHFFIFDDDKFHMPRNMTIEKYTNRMMFTGFDRTVSNFGNTDKFLAELSDVSLMNAFQHAAEYLIRGRKVHSKDFTRRLINELILELTNQIS